MTKLIFCFLLVILISNSSKAQTDSALTNMAKVYVIRKTGHVGSAINLRVFMDSSVVCKISNKHYSVLTVNSGEHTFYATSWDMPNPKKKFGLSLNLEAGKEYYLKMNVRERFFAVEITFDEITYNSAKPLIENLKEDKNCGK